MGTVNYLEAGCNSLLFISDRLDFQSFQLMAFSLSQGNDNSTVQGNDSSVQGNDRSGLTPSSVCFTRRPGDSRRNFLKLCHCHGI